MFGSLWRKQKRWCQLLHSIQCSQTQIIMPQIHSLKIKLTVFLPQIRPFQFSFIKIDLESKNANRHSKKKKNKKQTKGKIYSVKMCCCFLLLYLVFAFRPRTIPFLLLHIFLQHFISLADLLDHTHCKHILSYAMLCFAEHLTTQMPYPWETNDRNDVHKK